MIIQEVWMGSQPCWDLGLTFLTLDLCILEERTQQEMVFREVRVSTSNLTTPPKKNRDTASSSSRGCCWAPSLCISGLPWLTCSKSCGSGTGCPERTKELGMRRAEATLLPRNPLGWGQFLPLFSLHLPIWGQPGKPCRGLGHDWDSKYYMYCLLLQACQSASDVPAPELSTSSPLLSQESQYWSAGWHRWRPLCCSPGGTSFCCIPSLWG